MTTNNNAQAIHICPIGFFSEPVLAVLGSSLPCDRFYFLYNHNKKCTDALENIEDTMGRAGQKNMERILIDPFDYSDVITTILDIHHKERNRNPDSRFYINFTSGTNIVAGACCSASYFIGATLYYVMDSRIYPNLSPRELLKIISTPKIPDMDKMKPFAKDMLLEICKRKENGISMIELMEIGNTSSQRINHHLNRFFESGLITKKKGWQKYNDISDRTGDDVRIVERSYK